jgi:uncharacterized protein
MRILPVLMLTASLSTGLIAPAVWAADCCPPPEHTLFTQGHGEVKVPPDALAFTTMTEGTANTVAEAQKKAQLKMAAIIAAIKAQEKTLTLSKPLKLQTQNVSVYPVYDEKSKLRKIIGYKSSNHLRVVATQNTGLLGEAGSKLMDAASKAGADNVGSLNFYVDDINSPKQKALAEAITLAKQNADVMAKGLGIVLKGVQSAEGSPQYSAYENRYRGEMMMKAASAPMAEAAPPVETGEVTVTCDVSVRFLIQD